MKKFVIVLMALTLLAGTAMADKPVPEKPMVPYIPNGRAAEVEPNDDFASANALTAGDDMNAEFGVAGDVDYFVISLTAGDPVTFETHPGDVGDTQMTLYDATFTQVAYDDDGGAGLYSLIPSYVAPADGLYYVMVNEYGNNGTGTYILTVEAPLPPPANDLCDGAIDLQEQGLASFSFDMCAGYTNQYTAPVCAGYNSTGPDAAFMIDLAAGENFVACVDQDVDYVDFQMYLITDCADPDGTCMDGDDSGNPECVDFTAVDAGTYYLIIDTWTSCGGGTAIVTIDAPVSNEDASFGTLKAMYR